MPRTHSSKRALRPTKVTIKLEKWGRDLSLVKQSSHHLLQPAELHYSPHNPKVPMTQAQRERSRDGNVKEECRKDGPIQAEACWYARVFECVRFYQTQSRRECLQQTERAYEKCTRFTESWRRVLKSLKIPLFFLTSALQTRCSTKIQRQDQTHAAELFVQFS